MVGLYSAKRDFVHWLCVVPHFHRHVSVSFGGTNWSALFVKFGRCHGVAGLITQGMISFMTDQSFLSYQGVISGTGGEIGYSLQNLMGLGFLGIWIIFSTI